MITLKNLHKYYKMDKGKSFHALKGLNIKFPNKGFVFVAGKSGCGKSTLMNVLGGLDTYEKGNLIVGNSSTKNFSPEDMDNYRNSYLGFIFQDFHLIDGETISENVALALKLQGYPKEKIPKLVSKYLRMVDLYDKRNNKISEISGGQKQRVAIARALIKNPKVIIADEPTGNLDSKTGLLIMKILKKLSETKLVIMVTHDLDYAETFADRLIQLKDGVITSDEDFVELDYTRNNKLRFKRSKFPFNMALKMAWTSVIRKKFRLILTILLFAISIGLVSFITSFNFYSTEDLFYQFIEETDTRSIQFSEGRDENFQFKNSLDAANVEILKQRYPSVTFGRGDYSSLARVQTCGFESEICNYDGRMTSPSANPRFWDKHSPNSGVPNPDAPGDSSVESRAKLKETTEIPRKRHLTDALRRRKMDDCPTKDHPKIGEPMGTPKGLLGCHGLYHPTSRENHQPWRGPRWPRTDQTGLGVWPGIA
jgi:ABC-type lipoprotein export system ATPase subunit